MFVLQPEQYREALQWAQSLSDQAFLDRCDELFAEQQVPLLDLLTFARDGAEEHEWKALIHYLSILQRLTKQHYPTAAAPIGKEEFSSAVKRAYAYFTAIESDSPAHFQRMVEAWLQTTVRQGEEVVWAGCLMTLRENRILESAFYEGMVVTIYAVADCYSRRLLACSGRS